MSEGLRISQVAAGAAAAATAAVLGSTLGVAGTVVGAAVASVVSTVGGAVYLRSLERTGRGVRKVVTRKGSVVEQAEGDLVGADEAAGDADETAPPPGRGTRRVWLLVAGGIAVFLLGMGVVTGLELVRGAPLSGGQGTTVGGLVAPRKATPPPSTPTPTRPTTSDTAPPATTTPAPEGTTTPAPPSASVTPTTPSGPGTSPPPVAPPPTTTVAPSTDAAPQGAEMNRQ